jgi:hypothetical protein
MALPKLLRVFLAQNDALTAFERNVQRQRPRGARVTDIESAFDWSITPEGFDYWYQTNREYELYVAARLTRPYYGDDDGRAD